MIYLGYNLNESSNSYDNIVNLELLHTSYLANLSSILRKGLIPAGTKSTQGWRAYYHDTGVYFVPSRTDSPKHRLYHDLDILQMAEENNSMIPAISVVLEVNIPFDPSTESTKIVPDEETVNPKDVTINSGIEEYLHGTSLVYMGSVNPSWITHVYAFDNPMVREYIHDNIPEDFINKISYI